MAGGNVGGVFPVIGVNNSNIIINDVTNSNNNSSSAARIICTQHGDQVYPLAAVALPSGVGFSNYTVTMRQQQQQRYNEQQQGLRIQLVNAAPSYIDNSQKNIVAIEKVTPLSLQHLGHVLHVTCTRGGDPKNRDDFDGSKLIPVPVSVSVSSLPAPVSTPQQFKIINNNNNNNRIQPDVETNRLCDYTVNCESEQLKERNKKKGNGKKEDGGSRRRRGRAIPQIVTTSNGVLVLRCPECNLMYPNKRMLEKHLVMHNVQHRFICDICGAGLKRKEHLERHKFGHNPQRPYVCTVCAKGFKRKDHLNSHVMIHSGEKTQICEECGKGFYRGDHLSKHMKSHLAKRMKEEQLKLYKRQKINQCPSSSLSTQIATMTVVPFSSSVLPSLRSDSEASSTSTYTSAFASSTSSYLLFNNNNGKK